MKNALIKITGLCDNECLFCFEKRAEHHMSLERLTVLLHELVRKGYTGVVLSGGEPMMHPRILEVVDRITGNGLSYEIVTNGRHLSDPRYSRIIEGCQKIHVTLLSRESRIHDSLTGVPGSHGETMRGMASIREKKKITVNLILTKHIQDDLEGCAGFLNDVGAIKATLLFRGQMEEEAFSCLKPDLTRLFFRLNTAAKKEKNMIFEGLPLCFFGFDKEREVKVIDSVDSRHPMTSANGKNPDERIRPQRCKGSCPAFQRCDGIYEEYHYELISLLRKLLPRNGFLKSGYNSSIP